MSIATLADIIAKIRKLTVTSDSSQLTDAMIIDYINSYYIYDFTAQFRSLKLKDVYSFNTTKGIDTYPFDYENWSTVESPCYCEKIPLQLYQSPNGFRGIKKEAFEKINPDAHHFGIEFQISIRALKNKMKIKEIPTIENERIGGESPARSFKVGYQFIGLLIKEFFNR